MRAISLTQPWATLVIAGAKHIETRSWSTTYRGRLAIHAAKAFPPYARVLLTEDPFRAALDRRLPLPFGAVLGTVKLAGCFRVTADAVSQVHRAWPNELAFGDYSPGRYLWQLEDVEVFDRPIPARGSLGIWEWTP